MPLRQTLLALVLLAGCEGSLVGPRDETIPERPPPGTPKPPERAPFFDCAPGAEPTPEVVRRLTPTQYRNVLEDLLGRAYSKPQLDALFASSAVAPHLADLPVDGSTHRAELTWDTMDQRISPLLVEPQFEVATALGQWVAADPSRLAAFTTAFGHCAPTASGCVDAVLEGFGAKALRRPLDDEDRAQYRGAYADSQWGGWKALIASLLLAPDFLFRTEFRGEAVDARTDLTALTPTELANRVSFTLLDSMPDDALLEAAAHGFQGAGFTLEEQVARLQQLPRAKQRDEHFFRQWLRLDRVPGINPSAVSALSLEYPDRSAPALPADTDLAALRRDAFEELVELMTWYAAHGSLKDAVLSDVSFARSPALASVYGVQPWGGDETKLVHFPEGQRAGLFTRAGFLLSGYPDPNPVIRGARLRVEYLCDLMEPPANVTTPSSYVPPTLPTVRNVIQAKTEIAGTACQSCHQRSINPLGFPFDDYDAFGRFRTQEPLRDGQGNPMGWAPVDAQTTPDLDRNGDPTQVTGGVAFSKLLADSPRLHACFARQTFRATLGRAESFTKDACLLQRLTDASEQGTLREVARALVGSREFTLRRLPEGN
ncbi:MAG: DUF1592 domain-containing protein [Myxococcota bacterium]